MAKIHSKYLDKDFEVSANRVHNDNGTEEDIVTHKSLEDIILNQLPIDLGVAYRFEPWPNSHHAVASCIMSDKTGRQVQTVGEAMPCTLDTQVAKDNPTVIAAQRAFDKAATKYLALESKVVTQENPEPTKPIVSKPAEKPGTIKTSVVPEPEKPNPVGIVDDDLEVVEDAIIQYADVLEEEYGTANEHVIPDEPEEKEIPDTFVSDGDIVISLGRYAKNPQKLSYIYEHDRSWLEYVTQKTIINDSNREQIEAGKRYIAAKEGK